MVIGIMKNGVHVGYVKGVSWKTGKFTQTQSIASAKKVTPDEAMGCIDVLAEYSLRNGYVLYMV